MISAHIDQQTSFASHNSLLSAAISRDISSENDMTDEESTVMSSVHMKTMNSGKSILLPYIDMFLVIFMNI